MDQHANHLPQPKNPMANRWDLWWNPQTIVPDEAQFSRLKAGFGLKQSRDEYLEMVKAEEAASVEHMKAVIVDRVYDPSGKRSEAAKPVPNL